MREGCLAGAGLGAQCGEIPAASAGMTGEGARVRRRERECGGFGEEQEV